jgi:hypothetical protein
VDKKTKLKLKQAKKLWKKARKEAEVPFGSQYEDGRYKAKLIKAEIGTSQNDRLQITWTWKFTAGENKGEQVLDFDGLETEDNLIWLGRKLVRLGAELPDDLDDLQELLNDIVSGKPEAMIQLITKGDFQNLRIQRLVDEEADEEEEDDVDEEEEDEEDEEDEDDDEEDEEEEEESDDDDEDEDEEDDEDDEEEEEEVELESGMRVIAHVGRKKLVGTVVSTAKDGQSAKVRMDAGGAVKKVAVDKIEVPEDPPPAPKGKVTKKKGKDSKKKTKKRRK